MNEEIQQIKTLFSSTNKDDVVLGIILMKKLNLCNELFHPTRWSGYDAICRILGMEDESDDRMSLIYERELFYRSFNGFIGRVRPTDEDRESSLKYITPYYNDNSIPGI